MSEPYTAASTLSFVNPMVRKFTAQESDLSGLKASCRGVAAKSLFLLLAAVCGFVLYSLLDRLIPQGPGRQTIHMTGWVLTVSFVLLAAFLPLLSFWARPLAIVLGFLFAFSAGYAPMWFCSLLLSPAFFGVIRILFVLTVFLLLALSALMISGFPKSRKKLPLFLFSTAAACAAGALTFLICWLIPGLKNAVSVITSHPWPGFLLSFAYLTAADLLLLSDFKAVYEKIAEGVSIKLDWSAADSLIYSLFYLPFKIDILIQKVSVFKRKKEA